MTRKPCPGCGVVSLQRSADKVCASCAHLMEDGRKLREYLTANGSEERCAIAEYWDWLPRIFAKFDGVDSGDEFRKAFDALCKALAKPAPLTCQGRGDLDDYVPVVESDRSGLLSLMPSGVPALLRQLYAAAVAVAVDAKADGKQSGVSLLNQLAQGEITGENFNERAVAFGTKQEAAKKALWAAANNHDLPDEIKTAAQHLYYSGEHLRGQ